jgi:hypothetical protein
VTARAKPHAFNFRLQRLMIGLVAALLPFLVIAWGCAELTSISVSYHSTARDVFVANLAAVGALMLPYQGERGDDWIEFWAAKLGGGACILVALVPTGCPGPEDPTFACLVEAACGAADELVHLGSAVVVFACLFVLCARFRERALTKNAKEETRARRWRARMYAMCMGGIVVGALIVVAQKLGIDVLGGATLFWAEALMLAAFSIAWLTASQLVFLWDGERPALLPSRARQR